MIKKQMMRNFLMILESTCGKLRVLFRVMDLRRPKNFKGIRQAYINQGSVDKPVWETRMDFGGAREQIEIIRNPQHSEVNSLNTSAINTSSYVNNHSQYMNNTLESNHISIRDYDEIGKLKVSQTPKK